MAGRASAQAAGKSAAGPALPDAKTLIAKAMANQKRLAEEQERYSCKVHSEQDDTDKNGNIKKATRKEEEQFYVNGHEISRLLAKDGKALSEAETRKEDERVQKETLKYSDPKQVKKEEDERQKQITAAMRILKLSNERREEQAGRSTIVFDLEGDPNAQTGDVAQRFMQAMKGTMRLDEGSGELIDLDIQSQKDVKIGGGLVANLHKGFRLHVHNSRQSDGVWLNDLAEGSGDARAALFLHPYFRFRQTMDQCRLFNTEATPGEVKVVTKPAAQ